MRSYALSEAIIKEIENMKGAPEILLKWFSGNDDLRRDIKRHQFHEQGGKCCYCDAPLPDDDLSLFHLEHILFKKGYPGYVCEPLNLAAVCKRCNREKGEHDVLDAAYSTSSATYPNVPAAYTIPHPHFDLYSDHVAVHRMCGAPNRYEPANGSAKGRRLVNEVCKLNKEFDEFCGLAGGISAMDCVQGIQDVLSGRNIENIVDLAEALGPFVDVIQDVNAKRLANRMAGRRKAG